jgi:hypothetical protein
MLRQLIFSCALAATTFGCYPTQYTHIEKVSDGYVLTKNQGGVFRVSGELWRCRPQGEKHFECTKTASD